MWAETKGRSFFITGGTGFFGMWLLESFAYINDSLGLEARATVLTRNPNAFAEKAPHLSSRHDLTFIKGDVRDFVFPKGNFDYIIHAATETSAKLNDGLPHELLDAIVAGMSRVLDFAATAKARKFLFTSSGAVYGLQPSELTHIPEDFHGAPDCLNAGSVYGEGKRVAELMAVIHAQHFSTQIKIARCFAFIGPHLPLKSHFAVANFLREAMTGKPIEIKGDGTPFRSYLYASDLATWLWTILFKGKSLRPYNVGSEDDLSISSLAYYVRDTLDSKSPIRLDTTYISGAPISRYVPSVLRSETELGLRATVSLRDAILRTASWHRSTEAQI
jgi:dTDP-glucose 4,6-dehydratase